MVIPPQLKACKSFKICQKSRMRDYAHQYLKNTVRIASVCLSSCLVISCATPPETLSKSSQTEKTGDNLTLRNLKNGDCGLFIWVGESLNFVLFVEGSTKAQFLQNKTEIDLIPKEQLSVADPYGQFPKQSFTDKSGQIYTLDLTESKPVLDSIRYTRGLWSTKDEEGWDVVKAAYGYSSCLNKKRSKAPTPEFKVAPQLPQIFAPKASTVPSTVKPSIFEQQTIIAEDRLEISSPEVIAPPPEPSPSPAIETLKNKITIQLASERTPLKAEDRWLKITEKHPNLLRFTRRIEEVELAEKGIFYRLRISGFETRQDALNLCRNLKDMKQDCFVPQ